MLKTIHTHFAMLTACIAITTQAGAKAGETDQQTGANASTTISAPGAEIGRPIAKIKADSFVRRARKVNQEAPALGESFTALERSKMLGSIAASSPANAAVFTPALAQAMASLPTPVSSGASTPSTSFAASAVSSVHAGLPPISGIASLSSDTAIQRVPDKQLQGGSSVSSASAGRPAHAPIVVIPPVAPSPQAIISLP